MSLVKFELKEDHLKLLKNLQWSKTDTNHLLSISGIDSDYSEDVILTPFGGDDLMEDIGQIIYGQPEGEDIVPMSYDEEGDGTFKYKYCDEEIKYMEELFDGLSIALDICLFTQSFVAGHYKTRYHLRDWKMYTPKDK